MPGMEYTSHISATPSMCHMNLLMCRVLAKCHLAENTCASGESEKLCATVKRHQPTDVMLGWKSVPEEPDPMLMIPLDDGFQCLDVFQGQLAHISQPFLLERHLTHLPVDNYNMCFPSVYILHYCI